jgi:hypothetical protein
VRELREKKRKFALIKRFPSTVQHNTCTTPKKPVIPKPALQQVREIVKKNENLH